MMKVFKPDYYDEFKCIADRCDLTCCRDWTITVDEDTYNRWGQIDDSYQDKTEQHGEVRRIRLEDGKCPFLDKYGLCNIVSAYGEEAISHTCHTYPRETHTFTDRIEQSLTLSCKSVIDLLWSKERFNVICCDEEATGSDDPDDCCDELLFVLRQWFIEIASDKSYSISDALKIIFYIILDIRDKEIDSMQELEEYQQSGMVAQLVAVITDEKKQTDILDRFIEDNELLLDLFIRYYEQKKYIEVIGPIYEKASIFESEIDDGIAIEEYEKYLEANNGSYEDQIRLVICEEIWSSLLVSYFDIENMIVKIEWLALELVLLKHWMFLHYNTYGRLGSEDLKHIVALLFRTTGYCDDDILEYMEESFEEIIWDWGYMDLIL